MPRALRRDLYARTLSNGSPNGDPEFFIPVTGKSGE